MTSEETSTTAVIYVRISQDRTGEELGISRQREDAEALCKLRGWKVVEVFTDNDVSASGTRRRPGFEAMLRAIEDGRAQAVVAWELPRLTRNARDSLRLIELGEQRGITVALVRGSDMNLSTAAGRMLASILAAVARNEIEQKSERQRRAVAQAAQQGRWVGGRRAFGYEADGITKRESEADAVRWAYDAVLSGASLGSVAREWNGRGLRTPQRGHVHGQGCECAPNIPARSCPARTLADEHSSWIGQTVRDTLLNPRYAGLRAHVPEQQRKAARYMRLAGIVGQAQWPEVVSEETFRAAVELLTDPSRAKPGRSGRQLMTGTALCGVCKATVHAGGAAKQQNGQQYAMYRCAGSTGHVCRAAGPVDWFVGEVAIERLSRPDAAALLSRDSGPDAAALRREARALRSRIDGLASLLADGTLTASAVRRESEKLHGKLAEVEARMADAGRASVLAPLVQADDVRAAWKALDTDRQRAIIDALMSVTLLPPGRGTRFGKTVQSWECSAQRISDSIVIDWL